MKAEPVSLVLKIFPWLLISLTVKIIHSLYNGLKVFVWSGPSPPLLHYLSYPSQTHGLLWNEFCGWLPHLLCLITTFSMRPTLTTTCIIAIHFLPTLHCRYPLLAVSVSLSFSLSLSLPPPLSPPPQMVEIILCLSFLIMDVFQRM